VSPGGYGRYGLSCEEGSGLLARCPARDSAVPTGQGEQLRRVPGDGSPVRRETSSGYRIQDGKPRVHDSNPGSRRPELSAWESVQSVPSIWPDLRSGLSVSDCESLHFTRANGLLMGRRLETGGANTYTQRPIPGLLMG
jgi:hypothetical protein